MVSKLDFLKPCFNEVLYDKTGFYNFLFYLLLKMKNVEAVTLLIE